MFSLEKLVSMGFTIPQATVINKLFKRVGYAAKFTAEDLVADVTIPENKIFQIDGIDSLKTIFKSSTKFYSDIETIFVQKGNSNPFQGKIETVVVYQVASATEYGNAIDDFIAVNANYGQMLIDSRKVADIQVAAVKANANGRLFVGQTYDESIKNNTEGNVATALKGLNIERCLLAYHPDNEFLAGGLAGVLAQNQLGLTGPLFATVTNCTPQDFDSTTNNNLESLNVASYQYVNPVNGGGVEEYATPIVYPGKQIEGTDTKRTYIKFSIDLLLKAKSVDFLKMAYNYEDVSAKILDTMLSSVLIECQKGDGAFKRLIKLDSVKSDGTVVKGFELKVGRPSDLQDEQPSLYNTQTYPVTGYYRDALTGAKVEINLTVDPSNSQLAALGFGE
jgi:hypothetical protein|nr:MAG TPA: tail sheath protein [Caudoviricetes sp.]